MEQSQRTLKKELGQDSPAQLEKTSPVEEQATPSADGGAEPAGASALPMEDWGEGGQRKEGRGDAVQLNEGIGQGPLGG